MIKLKGILNEGSRLTPRNIKKANVLVSSEELSKSRDEFHKAIKDFYKKKYSKLIGKDVLIIHGSVKNMNKYGEQGYYRVKIKDIQVRGAYYEGGMPEVAFLVKPLDEESRNVISGMYGSPQRGLYPINIDGNISIYELTENLK